MYKAEDKLKTLLSLFTVITIFVACLGLLCLAAYAAEKWKKELGIRKILGATVQGLVELLSKDFIKLVLIALVVTSPVAWYFMNRWLESFAYRIEIAWRMFVQAALLAVLLALLTVSFQAVKAAMSNPVRNLRTEYPPGLPSPTWVRPRKTTPSVAPDPLSSPITVIYVTEVQLC